MSIEWFTAPHIFDGQSLRQGLALRRQNDRITDIAALTDLPAGTDVQTTGALITPGFIDLQVNGGGDVLLNQTPTAAGIATIAAAHRRFGTVAILPTLITDAPDVLDRAAEAALAARHQHGIIGLHIEGPHISLSRRGTHASHFIRPLDARTIAIVRHLRSSGLPVMITLAPEAVQPGQIAELVSLGAVVSLGHTDSDAATIRRALGEGANCFTHLYNAMSPMLNRAAGTTGAAINSTAFSGIICDGIHVADEMVALAIRARPVPDHMFLVSDAMPTVGGSDSFTLYGQTIRLRNGQLVNEEGSLAGAHVTMAESVQRLVNVLGIDLQTALRMAISTPARVIGHDLSGIFAGGPASDILTFSADLTLTGTLAQVGSHVLPAQ